MTHHVYLHRDTDGAIIYVGRTVDPKSRPYDTRDREWITSESAGVEVSPVMSYRAASWVEEQLIATLRPRHNRMAGTSQAAIDKAERLARVLEASAVIQAQDESEAERLGLDYETYIQAKVAAAVDLSLAPAMSAATKRRRTP